MFKPNAETTQQYPGASCSHSTNTVCSDGQTLRRMLSKGWYNIVKEVLRQSANASKAGLLSCMKCTVEIQIARDSFLALFCFGGILSVSFQSAFGAKATILPSYLKTVESACRLAPWKSTLLALLGLVHL